MAMATKAKKPIILAKDIDTYSKKFECKFNEIFI